MTDLDALAALAEAATPGPWNHIENDVLAEHGRVVIYSRDMDREDAAYIAAADPTRILALLAERDALLAEVDRLNACMDAIAADALVESLALVAAQAEVARLTADLETGVPLTYQRGVHDGRANGIAAERARRIEADPRPEDMPLAEAVAQTARVLLGVMEDDRPFTGELLDLGSDLAALDALGQPWPGVRHG